MVRRAVLLALAACALVWGGAPPARAQEAPEAVVGALYALHAKAFAGQGQPILQSAALRRRFFTTQLAGKIAAALKQDEPVIDFDPFYDGQDAEITGLKVQPAAVTGSSAVVKVTFRNFGKPRTLEYRLVQEPGWKIADIRSPAEGWSLADIVK